MRRRVDLVFDADCPNVAAARDALRQALEQVDPAALWREWDRGAADAPEWVRGHGSPTILVDGEDVAGSAAHGGAGACRLYVGANGERAAAPPVEAIVRALRTAAGNENDSEEQE